jgi:hypothetical protein
MRLYVLEKVTEPPSLFPSVTVAMTIDILEPTNDNQLAYAAATITHPLTS